MDISNVLILGVNGGFGRLFARLLSAAGVKVAGADLAERPATDVSCDAYFACDLTRPSEQLKGAAAEADCLLFCLPESAALPALQTFAAIAAPDSLLLDTLSIKTPVAEALRMTPGTIQHLSVNPMFAPDVGFAAQNVAAVAITPGPRCTRFISLMEQWGANIMLMSVEDHDRQTAITQTATHAAVLAFGHCLKTLGYDAETALSISTPPHRMLMALLARITSKDPEVYWEIQVDNPYSAAARTALLDALKTIDEMAGANQRQAFHELFASTRQTLDPVMPQWLAIAERLIRSA